MGILRSQDKIGALSHSAGNILMAASVASPAYLTIGGRQFKVQAQLSVADPSFASNELYYVYAVQSAGVVSIVTSTRINSLGPAGYTGWKLIGAFYTDYLSAFNDFVSTNGTTPTTMRVITSGSGTYTAPTRAKAIRAKAVGGGSSGGTPSADCTVGNATTFGTLTAGGGTGAGTSGVPTQGGTATGGDINIPGGGGQGGGAAGNAGQGGSSIFGGSGSGANSGASNGGSAAANSGAGGGGGSGGSSRSGGGSGGYVEKFILSPTSYSYSVGGVATAPSGAGNGAAGIIIIEEFKPNLKDLEDL